MAGRQYPYIQARVPWSDADWEYVRGFHNGLPLLAWGQADRTRLATLRQLKKRGKRPSHRGDIVAYMYFRSRKYPTKNPVYAGLYLVKDAKDRQDVTEAKRGAIEAALAARRICPVCESYGEDYIQRSIGRCTGCEFSRGWEPWDARHDLVIGEPTLSSQDLAALPTPGLDWEDPGPDAPEVLACASGDRRPLMVQAREAQFAESQKKPIPICTFPQRTPGRSGLGKLPPTFPQGTSCANSPVTQTIGPSHSDVNTERNHREVNSLLMGVTNTQETSVMATRLPAVIGG